MNQQVLDRLFTSENADDLHLLETYYSLDIMNWRAEVDSKKQWSLQQVVIRVSPEIYVLATKGQSPIYAVKGAASDDLLNEYFIYSNSPPPDSRLQ
jgi:hypothetical protein